MSKALSGAPSRASARTLKSASELRICLGKLARRLREEANSSDLSVSQLAVLRHLEKEGPASVTELARAQGMRSQSMGAAVAELEALGFLARTAHPSDRRQSLFALTPLCRDWIKVHRARHEDWLVRAMQASLTEAEQERLLEFLPLLTRLADVRLAN